MLERAAELGLKLSTDLLLLGMVSDRDLTEWYWSADSFVFPSVKEGWGLAVLEAMAAGSPVITSDIPVFKEYLRAGKEVSMVRAADSVALADAMAAMVADGDLRRRLASEGPTVAGRYTWAACARQHLDIYRRIGFASAPGRGASRVQG